jgi:dihydrodipicolinate reductase
MNTEVESVATGEGIVVHRIGRNALANRDYPATRPSLIIDFSLPSATLMVIDMAASIKTPLLICSTGHKSCEIGYSNIPICISPNNCMEWYYIRECVQAIAKLNPNMVITIDDIHADTKIDKPSGTSIELNTSLNNRGEINSIRAPRLSSWHRINLYCNDQVIHLEHQVLNRSTYARGALRLGERLVGMPPGVYTGFELMKLCDT